MQCHIILSFKVFKPFCVEVRDELRTFAGAKWRTLSPRVEMWRSMGMAFPLQYTMMPYDDGDDDDAPSTPPPPIPRACFRS